MTQGKREIRVTTIPTMRYRDAPAAIEWLCKVLGFEKHAVYANDDGKIGHAQLTLGNGMIMLTSVLTNEYARLIKQPADVGAETQAPYLVVHDTDAVYARVQSAGARVVMPIVDNDYGGRGFSCLDPEGHLWNVGSYDPWAA